MERGEHAPARAGRGLVAVTLAGVLVLAVSVVMMWIAESRTATRVTLTMPCAKVDAASVGHAAYGLDEVLTAGCSAVAASHP